MGTKGPRRDARGDWDQIDVLFALRRRGWTLSRLSKESGHSREAVRVGLRRGTAWAMELVARVLGMKPEDIWPSRYPARPEGKKGHR